MVNWKKILVVTFNVIIGIYLLLAVTAFNRPAEKDVVCNGVKVTIEKGMIEGVLTAADVTRMLNEGRVNPMGKSMADVNLRTMEELLERQELIEKAECYKAQNGRVNIRVTERLWCECLLPMATTTMSTRTDARCRTRVMCAT